MFPVARPKKKDMLTDVSVTLNNTINNQDDATNNQDFARHEAHADYERHDDYAEYERHDDHADYERHDEHVQQLVDSVQLTEEEEYNSTASAQRDEEDSNIITHYSTYQQQEQDQQQQYQPIQQPQDLIQKQQHKGQLNIQVIEIEVRIIIKVSIFRKETG